MVLSLLPLAMDLLANRIYIGGPIGLLLLVLVLWLLIGRRNYVGGSVGGVLLLVLIIWLVVGG